MIAVPVVQDLSLESFALGLPPVEGRILRLDAEGVLVANLLVIGATELLGVELAEMQC